MPAAPPPPDPGTPLAAVREPDDLSVRPDSSSSLVPIGPSATGASRPSLPITPRRPGAPRTVTQRLRSVVDSVTERAIPEHSSDRKTILFPIYALRLLVQVIRQWVRDRCPQQASSLAFQTSLSIVPVISVAILILRATGAFEAESTFVSFLAHQVLPISREEIAHQLLGWADKMSFQSAGVIGVGTTVVLAYVMYASVEKIFNDIWRVERRRSLGAKFVVFYAVVTIVPTALAFSIYHAARFGLTEGPVGALGALGATFAALFCANKLLPATKVRWGAAAIGALVSALAFELAKHLFNLYVARVAFQSYAGIYGTIALVPLVLLWIYYSWLVVLLGAEISHSIQNLDLLEIRERAARSPEKQANPVLAARMLCATIDHWRSAGSPLSRAALVHRFRVEEEVVDSIFERLRSAGMVMEVDGEEAAWLPARPPGDITLADVYTLFRPDAASSTLPVATVVRVDDVLADLERGLQERARTVTFEELTRRLEA
jgi:membrane protein